VGPFVVNNSDRKTIAMNPTGPVDPSVPADPSRTVSAPPITTPMAEEFTTDHVAPGPDDPASVVPAPAGFPPLAGRCRVEAEIGRGGMGVVLRAVDPFFSRQLAVKVLQARTDERPDLVRRFLDEARLTGRLQHPGIPPVHEQGTLDDGRPYFTMKLIQGNTLEALLKARSSPLESLSRFITIFAQVCQTVAYAHSQGVIHRDLKPANVMVGAFGEVQVMDWGLARARGQRAGTATEATPASDGDGDGGTQAGQALGTPAFMPPEQARGEQDGLDERADVFGLGAILCTILTGKPPFQGPSVRDVLRQAQQGDLSGAWERLEASGADAELVALARACLNAEASQRPRDAGEVAAATARYLEGVQERLRRAEQERAAAQVKAVEERKRRRVQLALAAVVVAALAIAGGAWLWLGQQRATARTELVVALDQSRQLMTAGKVPEALAAARRAEGLLAAAGSDAGLRQEVAERLSEVEFVGVLERIRTPDSTAQERILSRARADARYAQAFRDLDIDVDTLDADEAARRIDARPALKSYLVAALDDWLGPRRQARPEDAGSFRRLLDVATLVDPDPWRERMRDAAGRGDLAALAALADDVDVRTQRPSALIALAVQLGEGGRRKPAVGLLRKAQWQHPEDFWLAFYQGFMQGDSDDPGVLEETVRCYSMAVALRPHYVEAWSGYTKVLGKQGQFDEAVIAARRAVELEPNNSYAQMALDGALTNKGDLEGARQARRRALELLGEQIRVDPQDDNAWLSWGYIKERLGDRAGAMEAYREAARVSPRNAWARHNVGGLLREDGQPGEGAPWLEEASRLAPHSAYILNALALARAQAGDLPGAETAYRRAIDLQPYYLPAYGNLADVLRQRGDHGGSQAMLRQGLRTCADVLQKNPNTFRAVYLTASYRFQLGDLLESLRYARRAVTLEPANPDGWAHLSRTVQDLGLLDEAVAVSRRGCRYAEPNAVLFNNLAYDLEEKGENLDEAEQSIRQALRMEPNSDVATLTHAEVLRAQGKFAASLGAYRRGHELHSKKGIRKWPTAAWVKDAERLVQRDGELPAVLNGERKLTTAKENLEYGRLCRYKQNYAAAVRFYEAAFQLDPKAADDMAAGHRYEAGRCAVLAGLRRGTPPVIDTAERARLRHLALEWLRADLTVWRARAEDSSAPQRLTVLSSLNRWMTHDDLVGVRDEKARGELPEAERLDWQQFWAGVTTLRTSLEAR
jgi:serine/threonine-protein kinase